MTITAQFEMMRLASPALPIGGFSYSQGLESAIELGWVSDEQSLSDWIADCLETNVGCFEAPLVRAITHAQIRGAIAECDRLHELYMASRETSELRAETIQMGYSLLRMLSTRRVEIHSQATTRAQQMLADDATCSLPMAWALAADALGLSADQALNAFLWAWLENQIAAAIKAVPLGQQSGQRVMDNANSLLCRVAVQAVSMPEKEWSNFSPGFTLASCRHETQYSRLFRS